MNIINPDHDVNDMIKELLVFNEVPDTIMLRIRAVRIHGIASSLVEKHGWGAIISRPPFLIPYLIEEFGRMHVACYVPISLNEVFESKRGKRTRLTTIVDLVPVSGVPYIEAEYNERISS
jgi:hypothetical protein